MSFKGADTTRLRSLSTTFKAQHKNLDDLIRAISNGTRDSEDFWKGPRANRFRDDWDKLKPQLVAFLESLENARKETSDAADKNDQVND
ncbi:WXG100 family type VII secretion target [Streptomyces sp. NPDC056296]|uniref:WXG100 family type VII secretion target n=1 Tax=Streptomyces sp. NPDC056296 TaxID=3345775 RepID=UPI0035E34F7C